MNIELKLASARWAEDQVSSGRFRTARDAVDHAVALAQLHEIKAEIEAAEQEGGEYTSDQVLSSVDSHLDGLFLNSSR